MFFYLFVCNGSELSYRQVKIFILFKSLTDSSTASHHFLVDIWKFTIDQVSYITFKLSDCDFFSLKLSLILLITSVPQFLQFLEYNC